MSKLLISKIEADLYKVYYNRGIQPQDRNKTTTTITDNDKKVEQTIEAGSFRVSSFMSNDRAIEECPM